MRLDIIGLLSACSYALDCVEAQFVNVATGHSKRVAYMSVCMAQEFGIAGDSLQDLAACALLHDNALTQYISEEFHNVVDESSVQSITPNQLGIHCIYGEENLKKYPFKTDVNGVILYHHENANGTGSFAKKWNEVPLFARIIHLCDILDSFCRTKNIDKNTWERAKSYLIKSKGTIFDDECVDVFFKTFSKESFVLMGRANLEKLLLEKVPRTMQEYDNEVCKDIADLFAKIIDYKSEFTSKHSLGVAECAAKISRYMGYDDETVYKMYLAGALHDIGKVVIDNDILEKPGRLTSEEFSKMKNHAEVTYYILSQINDFEDIRDWASYHHEKLDGSGYPFGKKGDELTTNERIMACVDIYQALTEKRPYKDGMSHEKACEILGDMAVKGWIDRDIVSVVRKCFLD